MSSLIIDFQVLPKSEVFNVYGFISPVVWPSNTAYAIPFPCELASIWYTQVFLGISVRFGVTLSQEAPPLVET